MIGKRQSLLTRRHDGVWSCQVGQVHHLLVFLVPAALLLVPSRCGRIGSLDDLRPVTDRFVIFL